MSVILWIAGGIAVWFLLSIIVAASLGQVIRLRDQQPRPLAGAGNARLMGSDSRTFVGARQHHAV
jgi:hypothetical protein